MKNLTLYARFIYVPFECQQNIKLSITIQKVQNCSDEEKKCPELQFCFAEMFFLWLQLPCQAQRVVVFTGHKWIKQTSRLRSKMMFSAPFCLVWIIIVLSKILSWLLPLPPNNLLAHFIPYKI